MSKSKDPRARATWLRRLVGEGRLIRARSVGSALVGLLWFATSLWLIRSNSAAGTPIAPRNPNFVFVLIDDMGWADGGCLGSRFYETPQLDRLASDGVRFTQAYAAAPSCSPTRAAILTGKSPARLHLTDWIPGEEPPENSRFRVPAWRQELGVEEVTIADVLRRRGYITASIGKWHLGGRAYFPEHHGFDVNVAGGTTGHPASYFWPYGGRTALHRVPGLAYRGGRRGEYLTDQLTDEAIKFITANRQRPFFLYLSHYAVHAPLMAKATLEEHFRNKAGSNGQSNAVYAAMLASVDESLGRVLSKLDELRLSDRTVVIFTSDNGGAVHFGEPPATSNAPLRAGKGYPFEGGLRVPLIVKVPWMTRPGTTCQAPVISQDFFPTILELAGASPEESRTALDGVSLVPVLKGGDFLSRQDLFWHYPHYWLGTNVTPFSIVRSGDWKFIHFYEDGHDELYDLAHDLSEQQNLSAREPETGQRLKIRLESWLKEVGAQRPVPK